ncbi:MAG: DUF63 family protein [Halorientalis sp.]
MTPYSTTVLGVGGVWVLLLAWWFASDGRPITTRFVASLVPWLAMAGVGYGLRQVGVVPPFFVPLVRDPLVYAVALLPPAVLLLFLPRRIDASRANGVLGGALLVLVVVGILAAKATTEPLRIAWILVSIVLGGGIGGIVWLGLDRSVLSGYDLRRLGLTAISAHALDGTTTAIGISILGGTERNPVSRAVITFGRGLPVGFLAGSSWLFVLVKLVIVTGIVVVFREEFDGESRWGTALLVAVVTAGLGPAVHNVVVFASSTPH